MIGYLSAVRDMEKPTLFGYTCLAKFFGDEISLIRVKVYTFIGTTINIAG